MLSSAARWLLLLLFLMLADSKGFGHALDFSLQQYGDSDPAAMVDGRLFTVGELKTLLAMRSARFLPDSTRIYGVRDLLDQARLHQAYSEAATRAKNEGISLEQSDLDFLAAETQAFARRRLFQTEVSDKLERPTMDRLRELYEEVKQDRYFAPERFVVRQLDFTATDPSDSDQMPEEAKQFSMELDAGESFTALVSRLGLEAPARILNATDTPTELYEALQLLDEGDALPPKRNDDTWSILYLHLHIPSGFIAFETSVDSVYELYFRRELQRAAQHYFQTLVDSRYPPTVVLDSLQTTGELALDTDTLVVVAGREITRGDLRSAMGWQTFSAPPESTSDFVERIIQTRVFQEILMGAEIERLGLMESEPVKDYRGWLSDTLLVRAHLISDLAAKIPAPTTAQLEARWLEREILLGREHGPTHFDSLEIPKNTVLPDSIMEDLRRSASREDFHTAARLAMKEAPMAIFSQGMSNYRRRLPPSLQLVLNPELTPQALMVQASDGSTIFYWIHSSLPDRTPIPQELERTRRALEAELLLEALEEHLRALTPDVEVQPLIRAAY